MGTVILSTTYLRMASLNHVLELIVIKKMFVLKQRNKNVPKSSPFRCSTKIERDPNVILFNKSLHTSTTKSIMSDLIPITPLEMLQVKPDSDTLLGIRIFYHVIADPSLPFTNVDMKHLRANHGVLNNVLTGNNAYDLQRVPFGYEHTGNAHVLFLHW